MLYKCQEIDEKSEAGRNCMNTTFFKTDKMLKQFLFDKGQRSDKLTLLFMQGLIRMLFEPTVKKERNHGRNENRL
jgi:hypothetical protein